jgi:hypothetical protein
LARLLKARPKVKELVLSNAVSLSVVGELNKACRDKDFEDLLSKASNMTVREFKDYLAERSAKGAQTSDAFLRIAKPGGRREIVRRLAPSKKAATGAGLNFDQDEAEATLDNGMLKKSGLIRRQAAPAATGNSTLHNKVNCLPTDIFSSGN